MKRTDIYLLSEQFRALLVFEPMQGDLYHLIKAPKGRPHPPSAKLCQDWIAYTPPVIFIVI
jgi:hypothetical protein